MAECDSKSSETQVQYEKSAEEYSSHCTITGSLQETSTKLSSCLEDVKSTQLNDPGVREELSPIGLSSSAMEADSSVMSLSGQQKEFDHNFFHASMCLIELVKKWRHLDVKENSLKI